MHGGACLVTVIAVNISRIADIFGSLRIHEEDYSRTASCILENVFIVNLQILQKIPLMKTVRL